ncbi:MAG: hypothetical protein QXO75_05725 [Nitrososphaerota archaeon]
MYYETCARLLYKGAELKASSYFSTSQFLRIQVDIDKRSCSSAPGLHPQTNSIPLNNGLAFGSLEVKYKGKDGKMLELGKLQIYINNPNLNGFYFDIPVGKNLKTLLLNNWTKGSFYFNVSAGGVWIWNLNLNPPFNSRLTRVEEAAPVLHPKPKNEFDTEIKIEEDILEKIAELDFEPLHAEEEIGEQLARFNKSFRTNKLEESVVILRNLIMNTLTKIDESKPTGKQRVLKESVIERKLSIYEGHEKEIIKEIIEDYIAKNLDVSLTILHKYVKDSKIIDTPDSSTIWYVYKNVLNALVFLGVIECGNS